MTTAAKGTFAPADVILGYIIAFVLCFLPCSAAIAKDDFDVTSKYADRDFSALILPQTKFLGYIGKDYQRLRITFTSVKQDDNNHATYKVKGYSQVKAHRNNFEGIITACKITQLSKVHYGLDDEYKGKIRAQGTFTGTYELNENPAQDYAGKFTGTMTLDWYVDRHGKLRYDDIESYSDGYRNNQYEGVWTAYASKGESKVANWGEYRIPDSGDLDNGAGEFGANPKYKDKGW